MTKDDIIRMAREAGLCDEEGRDDSSVIIENHLKRFAALVIKPWADQLEVERKKFKELNDVAALGMQHARAAERERIIAQNAPEIEKINAHIKTLEKALEDEREACAKVADEWQLGVDDPQYQKSCADAIRARGNT